MSFFETPKPGIGATYPINATDALTRNCEPLLTPQKLRQRQLLGLALVSRMQDPITRKFAQVTDTILQDYIMTAIAEIEVETDLTILAKVFEEGHPFDRNLYDSFNYIELRHKPVSVLIDGNIVSSDNSVIFRAPIEWYDVSYLQFGQINMVPLGQAVGTGGFIPSAPQTGAFFINMLAQKGWIPAWWRFKYQAGFPDGMMPIAINELIGVVAAINLLSTLAATWAAQTSHSVSLDGLSQSVSLPGSQIWMQRIKDLETKRTMLIGRFRKLYGSSIAMGNI